MSENTEQKSEWQEREIGALWKQSGKNQNYLSGHINQEKVVIFTNRGKTENPKAPDFRVYKSKPKEEDSQPVASSTTQEEVDELI
jgi:uncharacterized protein (DUF736 family)